MLGFVFRQPESFFKTMVRSVTATSVANIGENQLTTKMLCRNDARSQESASLLLAIFAEF